MKISEERKGWGLLAPTIVILLFVGVVPFIYALFLSFYRWNIFSATGKPIWIGADNFRKLVFDEAFLSSLGKNLLFAGIVVPLETFLGLMLAISLMKPYRFRNAFRLIHTLPLAMPPIAIGAMWKLMTNPGLGIIYRYLEKIGIVYNIGRSSTQAFWTVVLMDVWHWTPFVTLSFLAGLSALPRSPFEQAQIDGANRWQTFWHVTLPLLKPVSLTVVFIRLMDALRIVDEVWMLTGGGPGTATRFTGIHVWRMVFSRTDYGYGSAISVFLLYLTIVLSWLFLQVVTRREEG
ncbi:MULTISPECIES: carbohydrate ABC transporter permease [unclassified Thermotoga]|uniref:carbohydrate ABC transporter permease n=1 Tax=unclassified Thermotoga TaxID=2631113 RepID=UPI000280E83C|nr:MULTISPECIES: sugar ABC transporter permease [unclassified Thermotoga]AIY86193.1 binding-protein-dependent transport systems inner membrane component [Thermotoga sp. 2812B]EJX26128.1 binding-protein-dependent transport systems inner membrane component [Thermotoga sp. EMP]KAF2959485.1 ABC transporter substrate-binding protein [Thermotoga sp. 38H-to]KHC94030.1 binding-protein-dependent transport systems inner membrane component [Thermotoga sp. Mc24]